MWRRVYRLICPAVFSVTEVRSLIPPVSSGAMNNLNSLRIFTILNGVSWIRAGKLSDKSPHGNYGDEVIHLFKENDVLKTSNLSQFNLQVCSSPSVERPRTIPKSML